MDSRESLPRFWNYSWSYTQLRNYYVQYHVRDLNCPITKVDQVDIELPEPGGTRLASDLPTNARTEAELCDPAPNMENLSCTEAVVGGLHQWEQCLRDHDTRHVQKIVIIRPFGRGFQSDESRKFWGLHLMPSTDSVNGAILRHKLWILLMIIMLTWIYVSGYWALLCRSIVISMEQWCLVQSADNELSASIDIFHIKFEA